MGRMKKLLMPQGWMSGLCGKPGEDGKNAGGLNCCSLAFLSSFLCSVVWGYSCPRDLRTAHRGGRRIPFVVADRPRAGSWPLFPLLALFLPHIPSR